MGEPWAKQTISQKRYILYVCHGPKGRNTVLWEPLQGDLALPGEVSLEPPPKGEGRVVESIQAEETSCKSPRGENEQGKDKGWKDQWKWNREEGMVAIRKEE